MSGDQNEEKSNPGEDQQLSDEKQQMVDAEVQAYKDELKAQAQKEIEDFKRELMSAMKSESDGDTLEDSSGRVYKGEREVDHDLLKLLPAKCRKNVGWDPKKPIIVEHDHVHYFHSVDSSGRPQKYSSSQAGHCHEVEWGINEETGKPEITHVGPPLLAISAKRNRSFAYDSKGKLNLQKDDGGDRHTHSAEYIESERIPVRRVNAKAQESMARRAQEDAAKQRAFDNAARSS